MLAETKLNAYKSELLNLGLYKNNSFNDAVNKKEKKNDLGQKSKIMTNYFKRKLRLLLTVLLFVTGIAGVMYWNHVRLREQNIAELTVILESNIKEYETCLTHNKAYLEKLKNRTLGKNDKYLVPANTKNLQQELFFDNGNEKLNLLREKLKRVLKDYEKSIEEIEVLFEKRKTKNEKESKLAKLQKNWKSRIVLDKKFEAEIHNKLNDFITYFYEQNREYNDLRISFEGFSGFYELGDLNLSDTDVRELGRCKTKCVPGRDELDITGMELDIKLGLFFLLNNKKVCNSFGLNKGMKKLFTPDGKKGYKVVPIDFEELTKTIAHEIAHAIQSVNNIDKGISGDEGEDRVILSQCESSGYGTRDKNWNLLKPAYPNLVKDHDRLIDKITKSFTSSAINRQKFNEFKE